ncbi:MAG: hypothetical protein ABEL51_08050 [Salinibacter sp.]
MSARLISSILWLPLLIIPPLRLGIERLSQFLWPTVQPFTALAELHSRWVPFVVLTGLGYLATYAICRFVLAEFDVLGDLGGTPTLRGPALGATVTWVVLVALVGQLTVPLSLVAVLTVLPFLGPEETTTPSSPPEPSPTPSPPEPLPEPPDDPSPPESTPDSPEPSPSPSEEESDKEDEWLHRSYSWLFNEEPYRKAGRTHRFSLQLSIRKSHYQELRERNHRVPRDQKVELVNEQLDHERISELAAKIRQIAEDEGLDELGEIHLAMAFTLSMSYAYDDEVYGREYPKFPVEMLADKEGDCTDFSAVCGALLYRLGHDTAYVLMGFPDQEAGHAALGVRPPVPHWGSYLQKQGNPDEKYYYCEVTPSSSATTSTTTGVQWWLGKDLPDGAQNFKVYPIG